MNPQQTESTAHQHEQRVSLVDHFGPLDDTGPPTRLPRLSLAYRGETGCVPFYTPTCETAKAWAARVGLACFSFDVNARFAKQYLVCSFADAYGFLRGGGDTRTIPAVPWNLRHRGINEFLYEALLADFPLKIVLDMECDRRFNPTLRTAPALDGKTRAALNYVGAFLHKIFGYQPSINDWIILDASSDTKASRHAILNVRGMFFDTMHDVCRFRDILKAAMEVHIVSRASGIERLLVHVEPRSHGGGNITKQFEWEPNMWVGSFIDFGVYNHHFQLMRVLGATKYGHSRPFREATMNLQRYPSERELFLNSLLGRVKPQGARGWRISEEEARRRIVKVQSRLVPTQRAQLRLPAGTRRGSGQQTSRTRESGHPMGMFQKQPVLPQDPRHAKLVQLVKGVAKVHNSPLRGEPHWKVVKVTPSEGSRPHWYTLQARWCFYCPLVRDYHSSRPKVMFVVCASGRVKATCRSGRCSCQKVLDKVNLSPEVKLQLWP